MDQLVSLDTPHAPIVAAGEGIVGYAGPSSGEVVLENANFDQIALDVSQVGDLITLQIAPTGVAVLGTSGLQLWPMPFQGSAVVPTYFETIAQDLYWDGLWLVARPGPDGSLETCSADGSVLQTSPSGEGRPCYLADRFIYGFFPHGHPNISVDETEAVVGGAHFTVNPVCYAAADQSLLVGTADGVELLFEDGKRASVSPEAPTSMAFSEGHLVFSHADGVSKVAVQLPQTTKVQKTQKSMPQEAFERLFAGEDSLYLFDGFHAELDEYLANAPGNLSHLLKLCIMNAFPPSELAARLARELDMSGEPSTHVPKELDSITAKISAKVKQFS